MEIGHPNSQPPTPEALRDGAKLKAILERAIADGVISQAEVESYKSQARKDGKITPQELELYQQLVLSKISSGELRWDWD